MVSMLTRTHALEGGLTVHVRLGRPADAPGLAALLAQHGVEARELAIRRLLTYDPARRAVVCAFAPIDGSETLVGVGAIDLDHDGEVDTLVAEPPVARLLMRVLEERARSHGRRVA